MMTMCHFKGNIYTSYFARHHYIKGMQEIALVSTAPFSFNYIKLPILTYTRRRGKTSLRQKDLDVYRKEFLDKIDKEAFLKELKKLQGKDTVFMCHSCIGELSLRSVFSEWLKENFGIEAKELTW